MRSQVSLLVTRYMFGALRQLRGVRQYVNIPVIQTMVTSLVLTRLDYANSVFYGLLAELIRCLQSVQNAAARLVFNLRRSDHVTDALISLHWLRISERIRFKVALLTYRSLHGLVPPYLANFCKISTMPGRRALRSSTSMRLVVPRVRCSTFGSRSFLVAGASVWNSLPLDVTSAPSLSVFPCRLEKFLFGFSLPSAVI